MKQVGSLEPSFTLDSCSALYAFSVSPLRYSPPRDANLVAWEKQEWPNQEKQHVWLTGAPSPGVVTPQGTPMPCVQG